MSMSPPLDILILSNGPGELATWVYPVVQALRQKFGPNPEAVRISLVLSPCPHASGQEAEAAAKISGIDRVQAASHFWNFLIWGKTQQNWNWRSRGLVLFLGGDQFFALWLAKRLGYKSLIYAEWEARWLAQIDQFALRRPITVPKAYESKIAVVGDLMVESQALLSANHLNLINQHLQLAESTPLIGLLPGSKHHKLQLGVPLLIATADSLARLNSQTRFVIPVAPTYDLKTIAAYAQSETNPDLHRISEITASLVTSASDLPYLETSHGAKITLWQQTPNYDLLSRCQLCLTTVGGNTAELGALAIPMIVLVPAQQLQLKQVYAADGVGGLVAQLPGLQHMVMVILFWLMVWKGLSWREIRQLWRDQPTNWALVKKGLGHLAWPNIWATRDIIPELVGPINPAELAQKVQHYLDHPEELTQMRQDLENVRGDSGAAAKIAELVAQLLAVPQALPTPLPLS